MAAVLPAVAATVLDGLDPGFALRCAGIVALVVWVAVTLGGTVPINAAALEWDVSAPPASWGAAVDRWERLNSVRTWAAVVAFVSLLLGLTLTAAQS
jgi:uncharacterized membrane protein